MTEEKLKRTTEEERLREKAIARERFLMDEADRRSRDAQMDKREHYLNEREESLDQREQSVDQREKALETKLDKERLQIAQKLKNMDLSTEQIQEIIGLTTDEVKKI